MQPNTDPAQGIDPSTPLRDAFWRIASESNKYPSKVLSHRFAGYCREMGKSPTGREFIHFLAVLSNPMNHAPCSDPVLSAHYQGRKEMLALIIELSTPPSPDNLMIFPTIEPPKSE